MSRLRLWFSGSVEQRCMPFLCISGVHDVNMTLSRMLALSLSLGGSCQVSYHKVTISLSNPISQKPITQFSTHSKGGELDSTSQRQEYLHTYIHYL